MNSTASSIPLITATLTPSCLSRSCCHTWRGESLPRGVVWAQYSYGWCLLHGVGVPEDPRAAVRCLIPAAKTHAEACYALGECYENGIGVDVPDGVEAFKYYRKAMKLGYRNAEAKVKELEKKLRAEA